jgi:3-dehydroquinate dehydratase-2
MSFRILVIHGPNLNLLGTREPEVYGSQTLNDINQHLISIAKDLDITLTHTQNNIEGELVNAIHVAAREHIDAIIINPAAYTHTSVAIRDALAGVAIPFVEVHLSNVYQRETFRHHSYFSEIAIGVISGLGAYGYEAALRFLAQRRA